MSPSGAGVEEDLNGVRQMLPSKAIKNKFLFPCFFGSICVLRRVVCQNHKYCVRFPDMRTMSRAPVIFAL